MPTHQRRKPFYRLGQDGEPQAFRVPDMVGLTYAQAVDEWTVRGSIYLVDRPYNRNVGSSVSQPIGFTGAITPADAPSDALVVGQTTTPPSSPGDYAIPTTTLALAVQSYLVTPDGDRLTTPDGDYLVTASA